MENASIEMDVLDSYHGLIMVSFAGVSELNPHRALSKQIVILLMISRWKLLSRTSNWKNSLSSGSCCWSGVYFDSFGSHVKEEFRVRLSLLLFVASLTDSRLSFILRPSRCSSLRTVAGETQDRLKILLLHILQTHINIHSVGLTSLVIVQR